jgi:phosphocarrier protein
MNRGSSASADIPIGHKLGLHARPAALFVKTAAGYPCQITISHGEREADAKSILGVLSLAVTQGKVVKVVAVGEHADEAIAALCDLVGSNFGEGE